VNGWFWGGKKEKYFTAKKPCAWERKGSEIEQINFERERESISLTLAFMIVFVLEGRVTEIGKKIKKTKDSKLI